MFTRSSASFTRLLALGRRHSGAIGERQLDVLLDGEVADQIEALKDEADLLVANPRALAEAQVLHWLAVEQIFPAGRSIQQAENRKQRGLAAARRAGHGHILAARDGQVNAGERMGLHFVGVEDLGQVFDFNQCSVPFDAIASPLK